MAIDRHFFPGNNTVEGFYSYYSYILGQREANRIFCIKGGPGVGKSTFMRNIGEYYLEKGEDVDFLHCSSDPESLDGVVLKERKTAIIDATSPHVVDPVNPGAVDEIIHLGQYWDEKGIRVNKNSVIETNECIKKFFMYAYNYFGAAGKVYDNLASIYDSAIEYAEIYKLTAHIVGKELAHKEICMTPGGVKKFFASAFTPSGMMNKLNTLLEGYESIYLINSPVGTSASSLLEIFAESAMYRGFDVEEYFCSMKPGNKMEHLLVPEIGIAFITVNRYHDMEPWEAAEAAGETEISLIDLNEMIDMTKLESMREFIRQNEKYMEELIECGLEYLKLAKEKHDYLEGFYIPNMDFKKIEELRHEIIAKIGV